MPSAGWLDMTRPSALVCGVDEAGRGPIAGAVTCAACILDDRKVIPGLDDSKKLSAKKRESLAEQIRDQALAWAVARADVDEIDRLGILRATLATMVRAVHALAVRPDLALIDGNMLPPTLTIPARAIVRGDASVPSIMAASILAKTARDAEMLRIHSWYPEYGFDQHKGYGTALHMARIRQHGICAVHRRSFEPIKSLAHGSEIRVSLSQSVQERRQ